MPKLTSHMLERSLAMLVAAAVASERCPKDTPFGPLAQGAIGALIAAGQIRSEVYPGNYRVVTILTGEHQGRSTKNAPTGQRPYRINGVNVDHPVAHQRKIAP